MDRDREPGTARYGNFINYYQFNPPERRIKLIPNNLLSKETGKSRLVLDVGCNTGALTNALYEHLSLSSDPNSSTASDLHVLGIDLDVTLINRAKASNPYPENISYENVDITNEEQSHCITSYLSQHDKRTFDLVTCFSVTLWVHINHGDAGLKQFLRTVSGSCSKLIVEPQPWKCYKSAMRRMRKTGCEEFEHFKDLEWREDVDSKIVDFLVKDCQMEVVETFGTTEWDRRIVLLQKQPS